MRELNTEKVMNELNDRLGGKGPLKCPVCNCRDFISIHEPLRVQTAYMSEDIKLVELVYLVCDGCFHVLQFACQDRWFADYIDPEQAQEVEQVKEVIKEATREALEDYGEDEDSETQADLESMLSEIAKPIKVRKPSKNHKLRAVPVGDAEDHERAQIEEARKRASLEDEIDDIFEEGE